MKELRIAHDLALPLEAITEKQAFLGRTGQGKSYAAQKEAELMLDIGAQVIALDPVGIWWGLRLKANGKDPGYQIPVFGGLHGDIPLEPGAGKVIADTIVDRNISAIIDVSQFETDTEKARFATDFGNRFFFRKKQKPSACHLFLEEAQEFVPQNPQKEEGRMLHAYTRLFKIGRNFGVGGSLISQRPQEVNKKVLNLAEILFVFQLTGPQERKTVEWWIAEHDIDEDISAELPKLKRGHPHVWSPALLKISRVVSITKKHTFDASATPKYGAQGDEARELAPIDIEKLRQDMAATIEKAKADDPRELRREIAALNRQLQIGLAQEVPSAPEIKEIEVPVLDGKHAVAVEDAAKGFNDAVDKLRDMQTEWYSSMAKLIGEAANITAALERTTRTMFSKGPTMAVQARQPMASRTARALSDMAQTATEANHLRRGAVRILQELAVRHPAGYSRSQVATLTRFSPGGGTFGTYLSNLRATGFIEERGDLIFVTETGIQYLGAEIPALPKSHGEVMAMWRKALRAGAYRMLEVVIEAGPQGAPKETIAEAVGMTMTGGTFGTYLSDLRRNGLIEEQNGNFVACDILWPEHRN